MENENEPQANNRVWIYTRIGLLITICSIISFNFFKDYESTLYLSVYALFFAATIFTFVNSIRHLIKYKKGRAFAITALSITGLLLLITLLAFIIGFIIGITS